MKIRSLFIVTLLATFTLLSCVKETEVIYVFDDPDIIENIVEDFLMSDSYGVQKNTLSAIDALDKCLVAADSTASDSYTDDFHGNYFRYNYRINYEANITNQVMFYNSDANGEYENSNFVSTDDISNNWQVSNILDDDDFIIVDGISERDGDIFSKVYYDSFRSDIEFTLRNVQVNNITGKIKSGEIDFDYYGTSSYGQSYRREGVIKYSDYFYIIDYN